MTQHSRIACIYNTGILCIDMHRLFCSFADNVYIYIYIYIYYIYYIYIYTHACVRVCVCISASICMSICTSFHGVASFQDLFRQFCLTGLHDKYCDFGLVGVSCWRGLLWRSSDHPLSTEADGMEPAMASFQDCIAHLQLHLVPCLHPAIENWEKRTLNTIDTI